MFLLQKFCNYLKIKDSPISSNEFRQTGNEFSSTAIDIQTIFTLNSCDDKKNQEHTFEESPTVIKD